MENKHFEELKELMKKQDSSSEPYWLLFLLLFAFNGNGSARINEEIKMKEDIAELKGKMSMIEKTL